MSMVEDLETMKTAAMDDQTEARVADPQNSSLPLSEKLGQILNGIRALDNDMLKELELIVKKQEEQELANVVEGNDANVVAQFCEKVAMCGARREQILKDGLSRICVNDSVSRSREISPEPDSVHLKEGSISEEQAGDNNLGATAVEADPERVITETSAEHNYALKKCSVHLKRLEDAVFEQVRGGGTIILRSSGQTEKSTLDPDGQSEIPDEESFLKDLERLRAFNVRLENGNSRVAKTGNRHSVVPTPKKASKIPPFKEMDKRGDNDDESETEWSDSDGQSSRPRSSEKDLTTANNILSLIREEPSNVMSSSDEECSDRDDIGSSSGEDDDESRRAVLRGTRSSRRSSSMQGTKVAEAKKARKSYYTPRIATRFLTSDSDTDDHQVAKTSPFKNLQSSRLNKRRIILSDSEEENDKAITKKLKCGTESEADGSSAESDSMLKLDKSFAEMTTDEESPKSAKLVKKAKRSSGSRNPSKSTQPQVYTISSTSDSEIDDFKEFRHGVSGSASSQKVKIVSSQTPTSSRAQSKKATNELSSQNSMVSNRGRRNIREILDRSSLNLETQEAETAEKQRKQRLARKQAEFNGVNRVPELGKVDVVDAILDFDPQTKRPLVSVDPSIVKKLKPHQAKGVRFMWENCFESIEQYKKVWNKGGGCILAHCMGLGKTFQTVAFVHTILASELLRDIKTVLIICPLSTVHNWHKEFHLWLQEVEKSLRIYKFYDLDIKKRIQALDSWSRNGGVGIISYHTFRALVDEKMQHDKLKRSIISTYQRDKILSCLIDPGPSVVICDEGHLLKNCSSKLSLAVNRIATRRRVILTGTPLQNNLMEYHTMMSFVKPNLLGDRKEFANRFANPIKNGQHKDSTPNDVRIMKNRAHVLHRLLEPGVQRLDYSILIPYLPPKYEYAVIIHMTDIQKKLYNAYLGLLGGGTHSEVIERIRMGYFFADFAMVSKIWSHPFNLTRPLQKDKVKKKKQGSKLIDASEDSEGSDEAENKELILPASLQPRMTVAEAMAAFRKHHGQWWMNHFDSGADIKAIEHSTKFLILMEILRTCCQIEDKVLVFSQYLYSLDLIEEYLKLMDEESNEKIMNGEDIGDVHRWRKGIEYFRLDGSVPSQQRQRDCDKFNAKDSRARLFLISTRAGGLGINLVGANRVVLFDASFNPANDLQGIFRVFRFGQTKPCYIYRLISKGSMEEKVYNRQVVKLSLSGRVVDEQQIRRHFTMDELLRMYEPIEDNPAPLPRPLPPKDLLLADLLFSQQDTIATYLEHDSLLQNQVDEKLTDEERRLAWEEYENERKGKVTLEALLGDPDDQYPFPGVVLPEDSVNGVPNPVTAGSPRGTVQTKKKSAKTPRILKKKPPPSSTVTSSQSRARNQLPSTLREQNLPSPVPAVIPLPRNDSNRPLDVAQNGAAAASPATAAEAASALFGWAAGGSKSGPRNHGF